MSQRSAFVEKDAQLGGALRGTKLSTYRAGLSAEPMPELANSGTS